MNTTPETQIVSVPDGSIRDYIDGKVRKDTPEEYVRQTIEKRLINEHKYKLDFSPKLSHNTVSSNIVQINLIRGGKDEPHPNCQNS